MEFAEAKTINRIMCIEYDFNVLVCCVAALVHKNVVFFPFKILNGVVLRINAWIVNCLYDQWMMMSFHVILIAFTVYYLSIYLKNVFIKCISIHFHFSLLSQSRSSSLSLSISIAFIREFYCLSLLSWLCIVCWSNSFCFIFICKLHWLLPTQYIMYLCMREAKVNTSNNVLQRLSS